MIAVLGFLALHVVLVALGMALLWVCGFANPSAGMARMLWPALGPAYLAGVALLMPWLVIVLLLGIPLTFGSATVVAALGIAALLVVGRRLRRHFPSARPTTALDCAPAVAGGAAPRAAALRSPRAWVITLAGAFVAWGAFAFARLATVGDDARIWSLRGLTLTYYGRLQPEIFLNPSQSGGHPVYPLLQPVLEAVLSSATGGPMLRFFHAELWLLFTAAVWTAGFLILRRPGRPPPGRRSSPGYPPCRCWRSCRQTSATSSSVTPTP